MWKNKHVVVAMLVAPILAILAWFAVDSMVAERAHSAKPGASYKLIAKSNCRYASGKCDMENAEFKISLTPVEAPRGVTAFELESVFGLASANISLFRPAGEVVATAAPLEAEVPGTRWRLTIPAAITPDASLRVAVTAQQSIYYAEIPLTFTEEPDQRYTR